MKVVEIPFTGKNWQMLPVKKGLCPQCAVDHTPDEPHNQQSLTWQYSFRLKHNRWPTWGDALEHCPNEIKAAWRKALIEAGIPAEKLEPSKPETSVP